MIYEFIATLAAGFGMAGCAMIIRHLTKLAGKQAPKWLVPIFAALGILGFQIHQEYYWYEQRASQLPPNIQVVKTIKSSVWYRPWSYLKPQIVRFMAIDTQYNTVNDVAINDNNLHSPQASQLKIFNLYLFERRISDKHLIQVMDCENSKRADYMAQSQSPIQELTWHSLPSDDPILQAICYSD